MNKRDLEDWLEWAKFSNNMKTGVIKALNLWKEDMQDYFNDIQADEFIN